MFLLYLSVSMRVVIGQLAIRIPLYGSLKCKVGFVVKLFHIYRQVFLTFIARGSLKLSYTLNCVMKRAKDLKTMSN